MAALIFFYTLAVLFFLFLFAVIAVSLVFLVDIGNGFLRMMREETWAPFVPSRAHAVKEILGALDLRNDSLMYELGCGDARVLAACAKRHSKARFVGIENDILPFMLAYLRLRKVRAPHVELKRADFFSVDLSPATHLYAYLLPEIMDELYLKFVRELKPGARLVSLDFPLRQKHPSQVIPLKNGAWLGHDLYVYDF